MIYLDNSATSYPKPKCVIEGVKQSLIKYGANSGRGDYKMALETTEKIYNCRKKVANFFNVSKPENVIFTYNCTSALNMAIKGVAKRGSHFVISDLEHNAVLRPLHSLKQMGISDYSIAKVEIDLFKTIKNFEKSINKNTVAIVCTGASNVFGIIPPYTLLSALAHRYGLLFILDGSQSAGSIKINMNKSNVDIMCCSAHKGLLGTTGLGLMVINNDVLLNTIIEGGTGSNSAEFLQPLNYPDRLESGTPNITGVISLSNSIDFLNEITVEKIHNHEMKLLKYFHKSLKDNYRIKFYTDLLNNNKTYSPIVSFNIQDMHSEDVAYILNEDGFAVRAGLHCAPLAHKKFNTIETGTVRISPSIFTKKDDIDLLINSVRKIAK